ncbi:hypothetical protein ULG90_05475 [Halopseudomonas pachastrellae]|nr:hypothetical protein ULG90_05475 [Halopseudomonas pachastrellae]
MSAEPQLDHWQAQWQRACSSGAITCNYRSRSGCLTCRPPNQAGLTDSFAAIRLTSQRVMVNLQDITQRGLDDYALEVLAHEIGHHVYAPANMTQHLQLLAVVRQALPGSEQTGAIGRQSLYRSADQPAPAAQYALPNGCDLPAAQTSHRHSSVAAIHAHL